MYFEINVYDLFPFYTLDEMRYGVDNAFQVDIPMDIVEEYKLSRSLFLKVQEKLRPIFEECRRKENERYHKCVEQVRRSKLEFVLYAEEDEPQICSLCNKKQDKGVYQGGTYIGCNLCAKIEPAKAPLWPDLLENSRRIRELSQNPPGEPFSPFAE